MKQDRCLHVKNLIIKEPETVKVTSKNADFVPQNYANDILGNLSRGIRLAWCMMGLPPPRQPLTVENALLPLGPKNHLYS